MANIAIKGITSLVTASAFGGAGYGIYSLTNTTDSVEHYLKKKGFIVTNTDDVQTWEKVLRTYKLEKAGFEIGEEINTPNQIEKWCSENLTKKIDSVNDPLFKKASKWCVSYQTIEEKLTSVKFQESTVELAKKYQNITNSIIKDQIDKSVIDGDNNDKGDKIKRWCDNNKKRRFSSDDKLYFENIKAICLKAPE